MDFEVHILIYELCDFGQITKHINLSFPSCKKVVVVVIPRQGNLEVKIIIKVPGT